MPISPALYAMVASRTILQAKLDFANAFVFYAVSFDFSDTCCPFVNCLLNELRKNGEILQVELDLIPEEHVLLIGMNLISTVLWNCWSTCPPELTFT